MTNPTKPIGVVLAGGLSRRMNGPEKSLLALGGKPLLEHVISRFSKQVDRLIINANGNPNRFSSYNLPIVPDTVEGFAGPLAGVLAAMHWVKKNAPEHKSIITVAADTPFFPTSYLDEMLIAHHENAKITFAFSNQRKHPVFGMWNIELADELEHFLVVEENRKVMLFAQRYEMGNHEFSDENGIDPFFNINTPEDLKTAEELIANT